MISKSKVVLLLANLIPLFGVIFFGWSLFSIIFLYWFENIVIGIYNVLRMLKSEGGGPDKRYQMTVNGQLKMVTKTSLAGFFAFHYGLFTLVHGVFVFQLFGPPDIPLHSFVVAAASLFISHGVSHATNFIGREEYRRISADRLMMQPYARIIVIHLTVLFGGFLVQAFGAPILALVLMIGLKTILDLVSHSLEHRKLES